MLMSYTSYLIGENNKYIVLMWENYWCINLHIKYTKFFYQILYNIGYLIMYLAQRLKRQDFYKFNYQ